MAYDTQNAGPSQGQEERGSDRWNHTRCLQWGAYASTDHGSVLRGSPSLTVCRNCQQSEYALLGCPFEHPENFSKVSQSVIMVYYHLFFPFMLTRCANIMQYLCFKLKLIAFYSHSIFKLGSTQTALYL